MSSRSRQLVLLVAAVLAAIAWFAWQKRELAPVRGASDDSPPSSADSPAGDFRSTNELPEIAALVDRSAPRIDAATDVHDSAANISVLGRVVDELGRPIERFGLRAIHRDANNWYLETREWPVEQHEGGEFDLNGLPAGRWEIAPFAEGLKLRQPLALSFAVAQRLAFVMSGAAVIRGTVVDPDGVPVAGARVVVREPAWTHHGGEERETRALTTAGNGVFELEVASGLYFLGAESDAWVSSNPVEIVIGTGDVRGDLVLALRRGGSLRGTALSANGEPLAGWTLSASSGPAQDVETAVLDAHGEFALSRLESGELTLTLEPPDDGSPVHVAAATVREGETTKVALRCVPVRRVRVRVTFSEASKRDSVLSTPIPEPGQAIPLAQDELDWGAHRSARYQEVEVLAPGGYRLALPPWILTDEDASFTRVEIPDQDFFELVIDE